MKKLLMACLSLRMIHAAQEVPVLKIVSDCGQKSADADEALPYSANFIFSDWNPAIVENEAIVRDNVHLSAQTRQKNIELSNRPIALRTLADISRNRRRERRGPGIAGDVNLPITINDFPFRIVINIIGGGAIYAHSFLFSNDPKTPGAIFMSVDEANSPETIIHFSCNKNNPFEIADWKLNVESPKRETHKAAKKPITQEESKVLKQELTPEEEKGLREQAQRAETEFVKIPKETGIAEMVAGYLAGELTPEQRIQVQKELEAEARTKQ